jgi:hypothetical protein
MCGFDPRLGHCVATISVRRAFTQQSVNIRTGKTAHTMTSEEFKVRVREEKALADSQSQQRIADAARQRRDAEELYTRLLASAQTILAEVVRPIIRDLSQELGIQGDRLQSIDGWPCDSTPSAKTYGEGNKCIVVAARPYKGVVRIMCGIAAHGEGGHFGLTGAFRSDNFGHDVEAAAVASRIEYRIGELLSRYFDL